MSHRLINLLRKTVLAGVGICVWGGLPAVTAQEPPPEAVPEIEMTFNQVLSSDSLSIYMATLSPDGRWVVFTHSNGVDVSHLWMASTEGGGAFAITSGPEWDDGPVWFPEGDRIAYRSGFPSPRIVSLAIDPATGRPVGIPQRVSLESLWGFFDVSPDGEWIAYTAEDQSGARVIRVVPSNGGVARTVVESVTSHVAWAPDGRSLYYVTSQLDSPAETLMRVPLEGGAPDTVFTSSGSIRTANFPNTDFLFLQHGNGPVTGEPGIANLDGGLLGLLKLPDKMFPRGFSRDGRTLLATRTEGSEPLRVLSLADGVPRTIYQGDSRPSSWTPNGQGIFIETALDGARIFAEVPVEGGTLAQLRIPERPVGFEITDVNGPGLPHNPLLSGDGRHLLYAVAGDAPDTMTLKVLKLDDGTSRVLTTGYPTPGGFMGGRVLGPGGTVNRDEDEFFYWEKNGSALILRASNADGDSRLLREFDDPQETVSIAVWGERLAYLGGEGTTTTVLLAAVGGDESREILRVDGALDFLTWSPDGRWLVATHWPESSDEGARMMLAKISASGELEGEPRYVGPGHWAWWGHKWLPDSSAFLTAGTQGDVWLIPVDPMAEPVAVTQEEPALIYDFILSPDGQSIAYAPWNEQGSSLWLIDLGDALVGKEGR